VSAVTSWPVPDSHKQLQWFLGFANIYGRFFRDYSTIAAPLTALTSSKVPFCWTPVVEMAFEYLKTWFTSPSILQVPDLNCQFIVEVDASDVGVGALLSQRAAVDQKLHPCAFFSAKRNYDIGNWELLAVKLALEEWRHCLEGTKQPVLVWTDHKNLEYIWQRDLTLDGPGGPSSLTHSTSASPTSLGRATSSLIQKPYILVKHGHHYSRLHPTTSRHRHGTIAPT